MRIGYAALAALLCLATACTSDSAGPGAVDSGFIDQGTPLLERLTKPAFLATFLVPIAMAWLVHFVAGWFIRYSFRTNYNHGRDPRSAWDASKAGHRDLICWLAALLSWGFFVAMGILYFGVATFTT